MSKPACCCRQLPPGEKVGQGLIFRDFFVLLNSIVNSADNRSNMSIELSPLKDIDIYSSESKLLFHLYERIILGELQTFESLLEYTSKVPITNKLRKCLFKAFRLQRKLYWGFFKNLTPKSHPKLWHEIVMVDKEFRFGGDLKRFMSIPDIYLGLLDIHGYTKFCHDKKRNMSMIDLLDRMIYEDVDAVCTGTGVISKRAQGDEILILGASAQDVLKAVVQIMDYFNTQGRSFRNTVLSKRLPGTVLPKFQISAGIAGGQKFTPLVITRDGDLSGDVVNTAARLQAKANRISPDKNRIMITNHIYQKFQTSKKKEGDDFFKRIDFFNIGTVEFKGLNLVVYDVVFMPDDDHRLELREPMGELYNSLDKKLWKSKVYENALQLAEKAVKVRMTKSAGCTDSDTILDLLRSAWKTYYAQYYEASIKIFSQAVDELAAKKDVDRIAVEYLLMVKRNYQEISKAFEKVLDEEVDIHVNEIYGPKEKSNFILLKKHKSMADKIQSSSRLKLKNRKKIWLRTADDISEHLEFKLQSFK